MRTLLVTLVAGLVVLAACADPATNVTGGTTSAPTTTSLAGMATTSAAEPATLTTTATTGADGPAASPPGPTQPGTVAPVPPPTPRTVAMRIDRRVNDAATADFASVVTATLTDARGWRRAGIEFRFAPDAPYTVVLAEGAEVQELCRPYDTYGLYSCQNGPVVALSADRWRHATPQWTGDLPTYRQMLVNHEVGHLLGEHHPRVQCPAPGQPAPLMAQQSTELRGCLPNPWPLDWEIHCLAQHPGPLAPPYQGRATLRCGPAGGL